MTTQTTTPQPGMTLTATYTGQAPVRYLIKDVTPQGDDGSCYITAQKLKKNGGLTKGAPYGFTYHAERSTHITLSERPAEEIEKQQQEEQASADLITAFADLLRVSEGFRQKSPDRVEGVIQTRLIEIGLGEECGRCGGTGHYSYNQMDGTMCYGCNGQRFVVKKLTKKVLAKAEEAVNEGHLDTYLAFLERKNSLRKIDVLAFATEIGRKYRPAYDANLCYEYRMLCLSAFRPHAERATFARKIDELGKELTKLDTKVRRDRSSTREDYDNLIEMVNTFEGNVAAILEESKAVALPTQEELYRAVDTAYAMGVFTCEFTYEKLNRFVKECVCFA